MLGLMEQTETAVTFWSILRYSGFGTGGLILLCAGMFALAGLVLILASKRWHQYVLVIGMALTLSLAFLADWGLRSNASSAGAAFGSLGDLARLFEDLDAGFCIAYLGCASLSILVCLGGMLGKVRSGGQMSAGMAFLICFSLLFFGTKQVITINRSVWVEIFAIDSVYSDRVQAVGNEGRGDDFEATMDKIWEELMDEDHPRLERMFPKTDAGFSLGIPETYEFKSTGDLAEFSDELKPDIERGMLLRSIGGWGLLGVVLAVLFTLWRKRAVESAAAPQP